MLFKCVQMCWKKIDGKISKKKIQVVLMGFEPMTPKSARQSTLANYTTEQVTSLQSTKPTWILNLHVLLNLVGIFPVTLLWVFQNPHKKELEGLEKKRSVKVFAITAWYNVDSFATANKIAVKIIIRFDRSYLSTIRLVLFLQIQLKSGQWPRKHTPMLHPLQIR